MVPLASVVAVDEGAEVDTDVPGGGRAVCVLRVYMVDLGTVVVVVVLSVHSVLRTTDSTFSGAVSAVSCRKRRATRRDEDCSSTDGVSKRQSAACHPHS